MKFCPWLCCQGDPVRDLVLRYMGEQEAIRRHVLTADSVSQDCDGLQKLVVCQPSALQKPHSKHASLLAPSSKLCQNWWHHQRGCLYLCRLWSLFSCPRGSYKRNTWYNQICWVQNVYHLSTNKVFISWQFFKTYGITHYGSGWRKDVINQCLEFVWKLVTWSS